jgi:hypothetical protein
VGEIATYGGDAGHGPAADQEQRINPLLRFWPWYLREPGSGSPRKYCALEFPYIIAALLHTSYRKTKNWFPAASAWEPVFLLVIAVSF